MVIKVDNAVINTDMVVFTTDIKQREGKLYWDIDNRKYVNESEYVFKIGFITGDFVVISDVDYFRLVKTKNKIDKNLIEEFQ